MDGDTASETEAVLASNPASELPTPTVGATGRPSQGERLLAWAAGDQAPPRQAGRQASTGALAQVLCCPLAMESWSKHGDGTMSWVLLMAPACCVTGISGSGRSPSPVPGPSCAQAAGASQGTWGKAGHAHLCPFHR